MKISWNKIIKRYPLFKYWLVVLEAENRFCDELEEGILLLPDNEDTLRSQLFYECLTIMREKNFPTPYVIDSEYPLKKRKADLALGFMISDEVENEKDIGAAVVVELKFRPGIESISNDLEKALEYFKKDVAFGCFFMIGDAKYNYQQKLKTLIEKYKCLHKWRTLSLTKHPMVGFYGEKYAYWETLSINFINELVYERNLYIMEGQGIKNIAVTSLMEELQDIERYLRLAGFKSE